MRFVPAMTRNTPRARELVDGRRYPCAIRLVFRTGSATMAGPEPQQGIAVARTKLSARPPARRLFEPPPPSSLESESPVRSRTPRSTLAVPAPRVDVPHEHQPLLDRARAGPLMRAGEVADYLDVTLDRFYELGIPAVVALTPKIGQAKTRSLRWSAAGVFAWLEERRPVHRSAAALVANAQWLRDLRESGKFLSARQLAQVLRVSTARLRALDIPHRVDPSQHTYPASIVAGWLHERHVVPATEPACD